MIPMFSIIERYTQVLRDTSDSKPSSGGSSSSRSTSSNEPNNYNSIYEAIDAEGVGATVKVNGQTMAAVSADGYQGSGSSSSRSSSSNNNTEMDYLAASGAASANYGGGSTSGSGSSGGATSGGSSSAMKMDYDDEDYTPTSSELASQMAANNQTDARSNTSNVDYSQTATGANYAIAAGIDGSSDDVSGGTQYVGVPGGAEGATVQDLTGASQGDTIPNPNFGNQNVGIEMPSADDAQYSDGVQKILVEDYGWELGADGKAINPQVAALQANNEFLAKQSATEQSTTEDDYLAASGAATATYSNETDNNQTVDTSTAEGVAAASGEETNETASTTEDDYLAASGANEATYGDGETEDDGTGDGGSDTSFGQVYINDGSDYTPEDDETTTEDEYLAASGVADATYGDETDEEESGEGETVVSEETVEEEETSEDVVDNRTREEIAYDNLTDAQKVAVASGQLVWDNALGRFMPRSTSDDGPSDLGYQFGDEDGLLRFNGSLFTGEYEGVTYENGVAATSGFSQEFDGVTYTNEEEYNQAIADAVADGRYEYDENGNLVKVGEDVFGVGDTVTFNGVDYVIDGNGQITVRSVDPVTGETTTEVYTVAADGTITLTSTTVETKIAEGMTEEQKTALLRAIFGADFDVTPYLEMDADTLNAFIASMLDDIADGGGADDGGGTTDSTISQDGLVGSLQDQIDALKATIASLQGQDGDIDDMSYQDLLAKIQEMFSSYNQEGYDPASYLNAFGFAMVPNADGTLISTASDTGMYYRKAVKDRDTGEIRYINVPINAAGVGLGGNISPFRAERRTGFGSAISV